jgi:hypothetical protein
VRGWVDRAEGRKLYACGEIHLPDGTIAAESTGLFIQLPAAYEQFFRGNFGDLEYGEAEAVE